MNLEHLNNVARALVADYKGLLAADESTGTISKRLASIEVEPSEENRKNYRELLFRTKGSGKYISGAILYDETIRQKTEDGTRLVEIIKTEGIIPGIKVDIGAKPLSGSINETITEGLDGLSARIEEYIKLGAQFAKWRAVIKINKDLPTKYAIDVNAHALARYAKICQETGLVPIVEPEVLMDGNHTIDKCQEVSERVLNKTFFELRKQNVKLEGIILKPNMIISGTDAAIRASAAEVAEKTMVSLKRCVPLSVPGIMFLSGGQSEEEATIHLRLINSIAESGLWKLSFSYGRALQQSVLNIWKGDERNCERAQNTFLKRAQENSFACSGEVISETP